MGQQGVGETLALEGQRCGPLMQLQGRLAVEFLLCRSLWWPLAVHTNLQTPSEVSVKVKAKETQTAPQPVAQRALCGRCSTLKPKSCAHGGGRGVEQGDHAPPSNLKGVDQGCAGGGEVGGI